VCLGADLGLRDFDAHNLYAAASQNACGLTDDLRSLFSQATRSSIAMSATKIL